MQERQCLLGPPSCPGHLDTAFLSALTPDPPARGGTARGRSPQGGRRTPGCWGPLTRGPRAVLTQGSEEACWDCHYGPFSQGPGHFPATALCVTATLSVSGGRRCKQSSLKEPRNRRLSPRSGPWLCTRGTGADLEWDPGNSSGWSVGPSPWPPSSLSLATATTTVQTLPEQAQTPPPLLSPNPDEGGMQGQPSPSILNCPIPQKLGQFFMPLMPLACLGLERRV